MFRKLLWIATLLIFLVACQPQNTEPLPLPTITEDNSLEPSVSELPGFEEGDTRPVATLKDDQGNQVDFVENELVITTNNQTELNAFLSHWQGKIVLTIDPSKANLSGLDKMYLVRVNVSATDTSKLSSDLQSIDSKTTGNLKVSSSSAHKLLAAAAQEQVSGLTVGINWVSEGSIFSDQSSFEAPQGDNISGTAYTTDAFDWTYMKQGGNQDIGVSQAWHALEVAGKLNNRVKVAILDMGFEPNAEFASGWKAISNVPLYAPIGNENLLDCGENPCPWHGTTVAQAAAGLADNNYGAAGSAGLVTDLILVYTSYDYLTAIAALIEAKALGAKIINMSFSAPVPTILAWSIYPFELATKAIRLSGTLLFAAAGNDNKNVDDEDCFGVCWESAWHTPCENAGVMCIGGLAWNSKNQASFSNYSSEDGGDDDNDVELFSPGIIWTGPDPEHLDNRARQVNGTSIASPFAAGIAALIWAADPLLSANEVEDILKETAHSSPDTKVKKYVNALGAVTAALGNIAPRIEIVTPSGSTLEVNVVSELSASVLDFEDSFPCCTITWSSSLEGNLGTGRTIQYRFASLGNRTLSVTATDSEGAVSTVAKVISVVNTPPIVSISTPFANQEFYRDVTYKLRGTSYDPNESNFQLDSSKLSWSSSITSDGLPKIGSEVSVTFSTNGPRTLTFTGNDSHGGSSSKTVSVTVVDPPDNLPPVVNITQPQNGISIGPDTVIQLAGTATDPEGGSVTQSWDVATGYNPETGTSFQTFLVTPSTDGSWKPSDSIPYSDCEVDDTLRLRLKATDPQGVEGFDFIVIKVQRVC